MAGPKGVDYTRRSAPPAQYDAGYFATELQNIQRAIPSTLIRTTTVNDFQRVDDRTVKVDTTTGAKTFLLLSPQLAPLFPLTIKNIGPNPVTLLGTVDGTVNPQITQPMAALTIQTDLTVWSIIMAYSPGASVVQVGTDANGNAQYASLAISKDGQSFGHISELLWDILQQLRATAETEDNGGISEDDG